MLFLITLMLALYQIINRNWQKYEQEFMPHPHLIISQSTVDKIIDDKSNDDSNANTA